MTKKMMNDIFWDWGPEKFNHHHYDLPFLPEKNKDWKSQKACC